MRTALSCHWLPPRLLYAAIRHSHSQRIPTVSISTSLKSRFSTLSPAPKLRPKWSRFGVICVGSVVALVVAVGTPKFIATSHNNAALSEEGEKGSEGKAFVLERTSEQQMLEESERQQKAKGSEIPENLSWIRRAFRRSCVFIITHVIEPAATGLRLVTLICIFFPVIFTMPVVYFGALVGERGGQRAGKLWWYGFLIYSLEKAGPTFIKLGQWAASRTDIFPVDLCDLMSKLHSNAKAHSLEETKRIIRRAFGGRKFEDIFEEFDETPIGVGAIAQVYKAKIKPGFLPPAEIKEMNFARHLRERVDGLVKSVPGQMVPSSYVAVKVTHPRVDKIVNRDLQIMQFFAALLNAVPTLEWFSFPDEAATFSNMMRLQMDLRIEAENLVKFRHNFKDRTTVTFPKAYRDYTTRDILIEEFAHGIPLRAFLESGGGTYQGEIANMGLDAFLHMLVMDNFIHSDLHPGNIMVRFLKPTPPIPLFSRIPFLASNPHAASSSTAATTASAEKQDVTAEVRSRLTPHRGNRAAWTAELSALDAEGFRPQLVFIDAGLVTELSPTNRRNFLDLFRAIAEFDGYRAGCLMVERSRSPNTVLDPEVFALKIQNLVLNVKKRTLALGNISFGDIIGQVLSMVRTHHVRMEGDFINVVLSMLLLEGIGRSLDPNIDLLKSSLPMLRAVGAEVGTNMLMHHQKSSSSSSVSSIPQNNNGTLSLLKVWVALEARQFLASSMEDFENLVKYDLLSPNI